ncbi:SMG5 like protein [Danaus plexippus plexippus]|uniref:SMG5 like protein n=1 Tax=Danaus plexippus plexippus TaxID=278856 RepID=A0A212FL77_DANPL|nr:SMG5 like protein [Danaus plexippus plexippus]
MKNGCDDLDAIILGRSERAKKVYRYVNEVARRLGEATANCKSITELFTTKIELERQKLRDNCEKLFFLDPINYGKKSLELLWRKVYYDTVSVAKKLRENDNGCDSYLFMHLVGGIGHFNHLMTRVHSEMNVQVKELDYLPLYDEDDSDPTNTTRDSTDEQGYLGRFVLYSCLIYLGDLSRYQVEIFNTFDSTLAARYYLQAAQLDFTVGMPFNQLGNLYLDKNYNLDSVSYYIHCLNTLTPFEGAMGNLTKIFDKNNQFCETLVNTKVLTQPEHMQVTIANFLSLIEIWYLGKENVDISQICNTIALQLKIAMDFTKMPLPDPNQNYTEYVQAMEEENINPSYLNSSVIHNIVQICLFTIAKLNDTDEVKAFPCKAFTLAFLSQVLQKLLKQIESFGLKNPAHKYVSKFASKYNKEKEAEVTTLEAESVVNGEKNEENTENLTAIEEHSPKETCPETEVPLVNNGDTKNSKKALAKRRRRRRVASSESSDVSDAETESSLIGSDKSDSEDDLSDSTFQSDDESKSEGSDYDGSDCEINEVNPNANDENMTNGDINKIDKKIVEEANNNKNNKEPVKTENSKNDFIDIQAIERFLFGDNFLPSIKLLLDWILTEKELILSCGDSGESLFQCVVDLLNIFTYYFNSKNCDVPANCKILEYSKNIAKKLKLEFKTLPLPEDMKLRGTNICRFDKDAAEWQILDKMKPTLVEENVIRILTFIDFGYQIAKIVPRIRFNRTLKIFYFKKVLPPKVSTKVNHKKSREWHNSKKQSDSDILRRLGRLWLASQVRELERTGQEVPSLLAVDSATLHKHLRRVKQLVRTRNFIFLVPTVVLQELDDLKRERSSARDAIRWLEIQLKSGSRFLRTQRPGQSKPIPLLKYPPKAPPHVHNFIQILEFCNHFISDEKHALGGNGDPDNSIHGKSAPILILLVGNEPGSEEQYKDFSPTGTAQAAGISVKFIGDFYAKWRQTFHKNGKKR